jgi:hypothetical protein
LAVIAASVFKRSRVERATLGGFPLLKLQNVLDDAVGELAFYRGGVRHAAETSQPIISRSKASQARRARSTSLCET